VAPTIIAAENQDFLNAERVGKRAQRGFIKVPIIRKRDVGELEAEPAVRTHAYIVAPFPIQRLRAAVAKERGQSAPNTQRVSRPKLRRRDLYAPHAIAVDHRDQRVRADLDE